MERKVYRNTMLEGVISKKKALDVLGINASATYKVANIEIEITLDDMYDVWIDFANENLKAKYNVFEEI